VEDEDVKDRVGVVDVTVASDVSGEDTDVSEDEDAEATDVVVVGGQDTIDVTDVVEAVEGAVELVVAAELPLLSLTNVSVVELGVGVAEDPSDVETITDDAELVGETVDVDSVWALAGGPTETRALRAKTRIRAATTHRSLTVKSKVCFIYSILLPFRALFTTRRS